MTPYLSLRSFLIALLVLLLLLLKLHVALVLLRAPSFEVYYLPVFYFKALFCISELLGALIYPHKEILTSFKNAFFKVLEKLEKLSGTTVL